MCKIVFAMSAASALVAAVAVAQTASGGAMATPGASPAASAASPTPAPSTAANLPRAAAAGDFVQLPSADMLSSNLVGLDVYDGRRNAIGKIKDVAFDSARKVEAYVVAVGGFLGVGERYVAVNPDAVSVTYDAGDKTWRAAMNATKDELKAAPEFKYTGPWNASRS